MAKDYTPISVPNNRRGLLVYHHNGYTLNIVLPKMWREENQNKREDPSIGKMTKNKHPNIVAYEGEYHILKALSSTEEENQHAGHYKKWKTLLELEETLIEKANKNQTIHLMISIMFSMRIH